MRVELRIIAGALRRRKVVCTVHPKMRPTPQMVREAMFSILGDGVAEKTFFDVFAGTGINGLEALSRGAPRSGFIERDFRLAQEIAAHARSFGLADQALIKRMDAYRWAALWEAPSEAVNVFVSPPFVDFEHRESDFLEMIAAIQIKCGPDSTLVIQAECHGIFEKMPDRHEWEERRYGRNELLLWHKPSTLEQ